MTGNPPHAVPIGSVGLRPAPLVTRVLIVAGEPAERRTLARLLSERGTEVVTADDGNAGVELLAKERFHVALVDLTMRNPGGLELLELAKARGLKVEIIFVAALDDLETAVHGVGRGAYHFLTKPFRSADEVMLTVVNAAERLRLLDRTQQLEQKLEQTGSSADPAEADGAAPVAAEGSASKLAELPYRDAKHRAVAAFDLAYFGAVLKRASGNVSEAARQAGLDRSNFRRAARRAGVTSRE